MIYDQLTSQIARNFGSACALVLNGDRKMSGIGTLGEKSLHAILKHTYEPDPDRHEIRNGSYYADIFNEDGIIEIQTRNFNALRKKLQNFLQENPVRIVYPLARLKWIVWINGETGEITKKRKSPRVGKVYDAFYELYKIKPLITDPNLKLDIVMLDVTEYRNLDGWSWDKKKGSSRYERIPENIAEVVRIDNKIEYTRLIPPDLTVEFTAKDFAKASGINLRNARTALNILSYMGVIYRNGKKGNTNIFSLCSLLSASSVR